MTVGQLIAALQQLPAELPITTWDGQCENDVEQIIEATGETPRVVLGMEMTPGWTVDGAKIIWAAHDVARRGIEQAQAVWARAKREWVG